MIRYKTFLSFFLFIYIPLFAQSISVGVGAGLNFITGSNYYTDDMGSLGIYESVNGTKAYLTGMKLSTESEFQLNSKVSFSGFPFTLTAGLNYFCMRGNESMPIYDLILEREFERDVITKMDIWSLQIGVSYSLNIYNVKPFISVSALSNYFDDAFIVIADDDNFCQSLNYKNGMRYGYSFGAGIGCDVFSNIELQLSANYNSLNVLHKRDGEELLNSVNILFNVFYKII